MCGELVILETITESPQCMGSGNSQCECRVFHYILNACAPIMTTFLLDAVAASGRSARSIAMNDVPARRGERRGGGPVRARAHVVVATRVRRAEPVWSSAAPRTPAEPSMQISPRRQQMDGGINKRRPLQWTPNDALLASRWCLSASIYKNLHIVLI